MGRVQKTRRERQRETKAQLEARKERKKERKQRALEGAPKRVPHTIESLRIKDETTILGDITAEENEERLYEMKQDELSSYFEKKYVPKILITTSDSPCTKTRSFCKELTKIIPNSIYKYRRHASLKKLQKTAADMGFSDMIVINQNRRQPNGLLLIHLPEGPTAHFRLSNVKTAQELGKKRSAFNKERPEVILNNFTTKLGYTVSRMLAALFHYDPEFRGSRCVTFHNQRDYIFFRQHRYRFTENAKPRLMELGPRFTLKLRSIQEGTFDSKTGEYIWIITKRRHALETSRRKFFL